GTTAHRGNVRPESGGATCRTRREPLPSTPGPSIAMPGGTSPANRPPRRWRCTAGSRSGGTRGPRTTRATCSCTRRTRRRRSGPRPVLVDGDENLHMDPDDLARRCSPRMKAVVVVHMRGFAADMPAILRVADPAGIAVIEDAVPALGVRLLGRACGTWGLAG